MKIRTKYWLICFFVWVLVLIGCRNEIPTTRSALSLDKGHIVYVSYVDGWSGEIYVMNDDGSGQTRLTTNESNDREPVWSPDGHKIVFTSDRDGLTHIFIMNADGSDVHRLTNLQNVSEGTPAWSPDGKWIVFRAVTTDGHGKNSLQLVDLMSGEINELVGSEYTPTSPVWSPDSQLVWFSSFIDQLAVTHSDLYTVEIDNGAIKRMTFNGSEGWGYDNLKMSPDGQQILHNPSARDPRAFVLDILTLEVSRAFDYEKYKEIYPELVDEQFGANWSPDGTAIIFSMTKGDYDIYADLYRFDFQMEQITQLTNAPGHEMSADWWAPSE